MGNNPLVAFGILTILGILSWYLQRESKNKSEERMKIGIGCLGVIGIIFFIQFIGKYDRESLKNNSKETTGKVTGFGRKNAVKWTYLSEEGKRVEVNNNSSFNGLQIGEKFKAEYDRTDLKNAKIDLSKPVISFQKIDTLYEYVFTHGNINKDNIYVTFEYEFENQKYQRQQELPNKENWEKIDSFLILVNMNNPKIAYLKPKK
jgi:hypothetical protein